MSDIKNTAQDLFDLLKSRFQNLRVRDENSKATAVPTDMRVYTFAYQDSAGEHGDVTVSIVDPRSFKVLFSKSMLSDLSRPQLKTWYKFVGSLKEFAKRHLMQFDIRDITSTQLSNRAVKTHTDMNKPQELSTMTESVWSGTSRSSYQQLGPITIVVRHASPINSEVPGSRSRNIDRIYLQNSDGERFKLNFCHMPAARAMANHVAQGGTVFDDVAQYITSSVSEMRDLSRFVRYVKRNEFTDPETREMASAARDRYAGLRRDLLELASSRRYKEASDRCASKLRLLGEIDSPSEEKLAELKTRFSRQIFNSALESALPRVYAAYEQYQRSPIDLTEFLERSDLALGLTEDDLANSAWRVQKFSNNRMWASRCLEDLAERLTDPRFQKISEFARSWSQRILETASDAQSVAEQQQAVRLTARYLSELENILTDSDYSEVGQTPVTEQIVTDLSSPAMVRRFQRKFAEPIPLGHAGANAILSIQDFVQDDELTQRLVAMSQEDLESELTGPGQDARPTIADWLRDNHPGLYNSLDIDELMSKPEPAPAPAPEPAPELAPEPEPAPAPAPVAESDDVSTLVTLSGIFRK
jgi:hypothetical protein